MGRRVSARHCQLQRENNMGRHRLARCFGPALLPEAKRYQKAHSETAGLFARAESAL